jgi:hypothetical protein
MLRNSANRGELYCLTACHQYMNEVRHEKQSEMIQKKLNDLLQFELYKQVAPKHNSFYIPLIRVKTKANS